MSERISGFTVVFEKSVTEDYMELVSEALKLYKGVSSVEPFIEDANTYLGQMQENNRIKKVLIDLITTNFGSNKTK